MSKIVFIILMVLVGAGFFTYDWYKAEDMQNYCEGLVIGEDINKAISLALEKEFLAPDITISNLDGEYIVINQMTPYFRYGCSIDVEAGKIMGSRLYSAK